MTAKRKGTKRWAETIEDVVIPFPIRKVSLSDAFPEIAAEWCYKKNCGFGPEDFNCHSGIKVWWQCPDDKRHCWLAPINHRSGRGDGCPYCAGQLVHKTNCLSTVFPKLAKEFHPTKNGDLKPCDITAYSRTLYWWKCKCGMEWRAGPQSRARSDIGHGCRRCNKNMLDLTLYPEAMRYFDRAKNKGLDPSRANMRLMIYWRCPEAKDHVWHQVFTKKCSAERFCPFCNKRKVSKSNCLAKTFPEVAKEFHKTKNGELTPRTVIGTSGKKVFWQCSACRHTWKAQVQLRTVYGSGCPKCWIKNRPALLKKAAEKRKLKR